MNTITERPWMTALEMQFKAVELLRAELKSVSESLKTAWGSTAKLPDEKGHRSRIAGYQDDIKALSRAETYSWSSDTTTAVMLASRSISGSSRLDLPIADGWWWFDVPVYLDDFEKSSRGFHPSAEMRGLLFHRDLDEGVMWFRPFVFHCDQDAGDTLYPWISWSHPLDDALDDLKLGSLTGVVLGVARFFLAGHAWMQQRIVTISSGHIERHRRKQIARDHRVSAPSAVKVVQLRRMESRSSETIDGLDPIEWSCRWVVNGHWRNQPYKNERKLIYILPFVKGPADKPLKVPK